MAMARVAPFLDSQCIYTFWSILLLTEFCQLQNSLSVQVLRSPILAALLHGTRVVGVSQSLRRGTRNGITELSQRVPPVFGRAAITLGIGPHSSSHCYAAVDKISTDIARRAVPLR